MRPSPSGGVWRCGSPPAVDGLANLKSSLPAAPNLHFDSPDCDPARAVAAENGKRLEWFRYQVARTCWKWLARRSRLRRMTWNRMNELLKRYPLPPVTFPRSWQNSLREPVR